MNLIADRESAVTGREKWNQAKDAVDGAGSLSAHLGGSISFAGCASVMSDGTAFTKPSFNSPARASAGGRPKGFCWTFLASAY